MEQKFYICEHCGNIIAKVKDSGVPVMCCGEKMKEIIPGTTEASTEKHIPVYQVEGNLVTVKVGSAEHPMLPEHYIEWVSLQTKQGCLPMATVYLDIDHRESLRRRCAASEPDRMEMEADSFHARVEAAYKELIARDPARFVVVDATGSPEDIGREIAGQVLARLMEAEA